jgi:ribosomal protein L36
MRYRTSIAKRVVQKDPNSKIIKRGGRVMVINSKDPNKKTSQPKRKVQRKHRVHN